jgi:hypothetical protein
MTRGATLHVRLNDASGRLSLGDGRDYALIVPFDTPLFVWIASWDLAIADETNRTVAALGTASHFNIPAGTSGPTFTFTITGKKK